MHYNYTAIRPRALVVFARAGTSVGTALGAGLPALPPIAWEIVSGAGNASGNGLTNVTAFEIGPCSGQIYVANNVLDSTVKTVYMLTVRAYVDNPVYAHPPQTFITVTVYVQAVAKPPVLAVPSALNATVQEHGERVCAVNGVFACAYECACILFEIAHLRRHMLARTRVHMHKSA